MSCINNHRPLTIATAILITGTTVCMYSGSPNPYAQAQEHTPTLAELTQPQEESSTSYGGSGSELEYEQEPGPYSQPQPAQPCEDPTWRPLCSAFFRAILRPASLRAIRDYVDEVLRSLPKYL